MFMKNKNQRGFTLIESLVLLFIFSITVMTFYKTYMLLTHYSLETKYRTAAVELATAEMEILRNTPYEDIILDPATSPPSGSVVSSESGTGLDYDISKTVNGSTYRILTEIYYVDDAEDGENGAGDTVPNDYKRVNITILWGDGMSDASNTSKSISLTSFFVPPSGSEAAIENGMLSVNVVDSNGDAVSGTNVEIDDLTGSESTVDIDTDSNGNVLFEDVPTGMNRYKISVDKVGSEHIETILTTTSLPYPTYTHASVLPGTITTLTIVQDIDPDFSIITKDPFGNVLTEIDFTFTGGHVLGLDSSSDPVYINTDCEAESDWTDNSADCADSTVYTKSIGKYDFTLDESGYVLWKFNPISSVQHDSVEVMGNLKNLDDDYYNGDGVDDSEMIIIDDSVNGTLVSVTDSITEESFECVTVRLENTSPDYDQSQQTDVHGMVYFPMDIDEDGTMDTEGDGTEDLDGDGTLDTDETLDSNETYAITVTAPDCVDDCDPDTDTCDNDCIGDACVDGCVIYTTDCTDYDYAIGVTTVKPDKLQTKDVELVPST